MGLRSTVCSPRTHLAVIFAALSTKGKNIAARCVVRDFFSSATRRQMAMQTQEGVLDHILRFVGEKPGKPSFEAKVFAALETEL